jgi:hypothetical protein
MHIGYLIVGYLAVGAVYGSLHCIFRTRLFRSHPSARLLPVELHVVDFLLCCMCLWPWYVVRWLVTVGNREREEED